MVAIQRALDVATKFEYLRAKQWPVSQRIWTPGPKSARANMDPPFADLNPPTKLSF